MAQRCQQKSYNAQGSPPQQKYAQSKISIAKKLKNCALSTFLLLESLMAFWTCFSYLPPSLLLWDPPFFFPLEDSHCFYNAVLPGFWDPESKCHLVLDDYKLKISLRCTGGKNPLTCTFLYQYFPVSIGECICSGFFLKLNPNPF